MANNVEKLLAAVSTAVQDLENTYQQLLINRSIDTAEGVQLDVIGRIAGQLRSGLDDDTFRRYVRARIATHNSDGTIEDLLTVASLIIYDEDASYIITQEGTATARLRVAGVAVPDDLGEALTSFILKTKSGGVRIVVQWAVSEPDDVFTLDMGPGWDQGHFAASADSI